MDEKAKTLKRWIRRKRGNRKMECCGCGRKFSEVAEVSERAVRHLPWGEFQTSVFIELYLVECPPCGVKREKVRQLARKPALRQMGVDEIHLGKPQRFLTVVCNPETGEPLWFGRERKEETLDESFRQGGRMRGLVQRKRGLLLSRWVHPDTGKKRPLNKLLALNRRVMKAYPLKESLDRLRSSHYEGAMLRYLQNWTDQLRWQRREPLRKLARMLLDHLEGILNYCRTKAPLGVVEAVNGNIKSLLRRGCGDQNLRCLLLKAQGMAVTNTELVVLRKAARNAAPHEFWRRAKTIMGYAAQPGTSEVPGWGELD